MAQVEVNFEKVWEWLYCKFDSLRRKSNGGIPVEILLSELISSEERARITFLDQSTGMFLRHLVSRFFCMLCPEAPMVGDQFLNGDKQKFLVRRLSRGESEARASQVPDFSASAGEAFFKEMSDEI